MSQFALTVLPTHSLPLEVWGEGTQKLFKTVNEHLFNICFVENHLHVCFVMWVILFFYLKISLFMRDRERLREKQPPHREPNAGLNPRTLGSRPEPKADAQPLSHPGAPDCYFKLLLWPVCLVILSYIKKEVL